MADSPGAPTATGLSPDPDEYRRRLNEQDDDQINAWTAELMRDVSIRRGVNKVVEDFLRATGVSEREFERVFAAGGGPPAVLGRTADGKLMLPAVTLHHLVPGLRSQVPDGRQRLISYIADNFDEIVYI